MQVGQVLGVGEVSQAEVAHVLGVLGEVQVLEVHAELGLGHLADALVGHLRVREVHLRAVQELLVVAVVVQARVVEHLHPVAVVRALLRYASQ